MPARRCGHNSYSMTNEMAGKCAFLLRRKPRRSKILVAFQGTSEWLGRYLWKGRQCADLGAVKVVQPFLGEKAHIDRPSE